MKQASPVSVAKSARRNVAVPAPVLSGNSFSPFIRTSAADSGVRIDRCACGGGCPVCEAKGAGLKISQPGDSAEIQADYLAEKIMRAGNNPVASNQSGTSASPQIHRKHDARDHKKDRQIQRTTLSPGSGLSDQKNDHVRQTIGSGGQALDASTRSFFEPRLNYDLGNVRIHTSPMAEKSAQAVDAKAYTVGNNIVFGRGQYQPAHEDGKKLLAHELTHVLQQAAQNDGRFIHASDQLPRIQCKKDNESKKGKSRDDFSVELDHGYHGVYLIHFQKPHSSEAVLKLLFKGALPQGYQLEEKGVDLLGWTWRFTTPSGVIDIGAMQQMTDVFRQNFSADTLHLTREESAAYHARSEAFMDSRPVYLGGQSVREAFGKCQDHQVGENGWNGCWGRRAGYFYYIGPQAGYSSRMLQVKSSPQLPEIIRDWEWWLSQGYTLIDAARAEDELQTWILQQTVMAFAGALASAPGAVRRPTVPPPPIRQIGQIALKSAEVYVAVKTATGREITEGDIMLLGLAGLVDAGSTLLDSINPLSGSKIPGRPRPPPNAKTTGVVPAKGEVKVIPEVVHPNAQNATRSKSVAMKASAAANDNAIPPNDIQRMAQKRAAQASRQTQVAQKPLAATGTGDVAPAITVGSADAPHQSGTPVKMTGGKSSGANQTGSSNIKINQTSNKTPTRIKPDTTTARPRGDVSPADADVLSQRGMRKQYTAYPSAPQHHVFPQELRAWFEERFGALNENIDDYTVYLSEGEHQAVHKRGKGSVVKGVPEPDLKGWNQEWKDFKSAHPQATPQEIFEEAGRLMKKYKIDNATIARYKR